MPRGIYKRTEETKRKMSKAHKGLDNHQRGKKHTKESKVKMSLANKGKVISKETKKKLSKAGKGNKRALGNKHSAEAKRKIGSASKGRNPALGKRWKLPEEKKRKGEKHPAWQGGISFEPYSVDWTETLKKAIRERDKYTCKICGLYGNHVHHIDYDKKNCNPSNLVTLCHSCHAKTNFNRSNWINYFNSNI